MCTVMKLFFRSFSATLFLALSVYTAWGQKDYTQYVDPFIGSGGHGHVFVGANVPFGAVQLGPQNIFQGWDWCSGYHYSDSILISFSHTHLSGTGASDLGDIGLMPYSGTLRTKQDKAADPQTSASSRYRHEKEKASPGYYRVELENGVCAELTATERVGFHHYSYNIKGNGTPARVLIDLDNGNGSRVYEGYIRRVDDYSIEGYRFVHGWAPTHKVFFHLTFNKPMRSLHTFLIDEAQGMDELQASRVKGVATFEDNVDDLMVKVAISSVSIANARQNMAAELPGWDFAAVRSAAVKKWNDKLSIIDVEATTKQKNIFYTAMYHLFIAPTLYCDVDGSYRGIDGKIYTRQPHRNYTTLSLWDTYRALHPLFTIIQREEVPDMINSMLSIYDQNGKLPIWPLHSGETNCMPGYSSVPVIADAYLKGIGGFDAQRALRYMVSTATNPKQHAVKEFMEYGYIPADKKGEATSINLEYAADDWGIALMAKRMGGHDDVYRTFIKRGKSYELLFDRRILKIHPKMADGSWYEPYDPFLANHRDHVGDFCEGNGWQYTFMVPQCPEGLIRLHGSDEAFITNLDSLFIAEGDLGEGAPPDVTGMVGQYAHGNEPNHHIPYLYVYAGAQWKTAARVRMLQEKFYTDQPDGYCGNEDCGQMSAWHILSALGFYQVNPSNGIYVFGSPLFTRATIRLPQGRSFTIEAPKNNAENIYIQSVRLNGKAYPKAYVTYDDIMRGGKLTFHMGITPNRKFGADKAHRPKSAE